MRNALLAAATLAAGQRNEAAEAPEVLLTLEVSGPLPTGYVASALPPRLVLLEDGQVFVGGTSQLAAGRLDKAEVKAFEQRLAALRKLPGLGRTIAFGGAPAPRSHLQAPKSKLDVVPTGDSAAAPPGMRPVATLGPFLAWFPHPTSPPTMPAGFPPSAKKRPLPLACRPQPLPVPPAV